MILLAEIQAPGIIENLAWAIVLMTLALALALQSKWLLRTLGDFPGVADQLKRFVDDTDDFIIRVTDKGIEFVTKKPFDEKQLTILLPQFIEFMKQAALALPTIKGDLLSTEVADDDPPMTLAEYNAIGVDWAVDAQASPPAAAEKPDTPGV